MNGRFAVKALLSLSVAASLSAQAGSLSLSEEEFLKTAGDEWAAAGEHTYRIESEHGFTQLAFGRDAAVKYLEALKAQKDMSAFTKKASAIGQHELDQVIEALERDLEASADTAETTKAAVSYPGAPSCRQSWSLDIETKPAATSFQLLSTTDFTPFFGPQGPRMVRLYSTSTVTPQGKPSVTDNKALNLTTEQYAVVTSSVLSPTTSGTWSSYGAIYNQNCDGWATLTKQGVY